MIAPSDLFSMSISSLFENKLRALLSLLGITIGIAAVFMIFTLSQGGKRVIFSELETLGLNSFFINRDYSNHDNDDSTIADHTGIIQADMPFLMDAYGDKTTVLSPVVIDDSLPVYQANGKRIYTRLKGVNGSFLTGGKQALSSGRKLSFFDLKKKNKVLVITESIAKKMQLTPATVLHKKLTIGETNFQIIGVLKDKKLNFLSSIGSVSQQGINNTIYLPYNVLLTTQGSEYISYIHGEIIDKNETTTVADNIIKYLTFQHHFKFDYQFSSRESSINVANNILKNVTLLGGISSLAALFVGGIGIMNME